MGRAPCCEKIGLKKGPWTAEEDLILITYIRKNGHGNWRALPKQAGLLRCGKSCRLRWINYLRPDIKRGNFSPEEEETIIKLHGLLGNKWSKIAAQLPGRTDNEIKNVWNTHLRKRLVLSKEASDSPSRVESKEICSNSFSSSESTISCLNQSEMTQDAKLDANNLFLDVDSVCRTDRRKEEVNKEYRPGCPIEIPLEPNLDHDCEMIDAGLNHSDQSSRLSRLGKNVDNDCNDQFSEPKDITYSASHRCETKPSLSYSSSLSCSTAFSTTTSSNPSTSIGHDAVNMTSEQFIKEEDDWKEMFTLANESNIYDFWANLGDEWGACMPPNMMDQKNEHVEHAQQNLIIETTEEEESKGAGTRWLEKLENELELSDGNGFEHGDQSYPTKGPDYELSASSNFSYEGVLEFEIDPIVAYFQSQSLLQQLFTC